MNGQALKRGRATALPLGAVGPVARVAPHGGARRGQRLLSGCPLCARIAAVAGAQGAHGKGRNLRAGGAGKHSQSCKAKEYSTTEYQHTQRTPPVVCFTLASGGPLGRGCRYCYSAWARRRRDRCRRRIRARPSGPRADAAAHARPPQHRTGDGGVGGCRAFGAA